MFDIFETPFSAGYGAGKKLLKDNGAALGMLSQTAGAK